MFNFETTNIDDLVLQILEHIKTYEKEQNHLSEKEIITKYTCGKCGQLVRQVLSCIDMLKYQNSSLVNGLYIGQKIIYFNDSRTPVQDPLSINAHTTLFIGEDEDGVLGRYYDISGLICDVKCEEDLGKISTYLTNTYADREVQDIYLKDKSSGFISPIWYIDALFATVAKFEKEYSKFLKGPMVI